MFRPVIVALLAICYAITIAAAAPTVARGFNVWRTHTGTRLRHRLPPGQSRQGRPGSSRPLRFSSVAELAVVDRELAAWVDRGASEEFSSDAEDRKPRIVGGEEAAADEFPYVVSLRNSYGRHGCAASLIDSGYLLTAAHCTTSRTGYREDWFVEAWIGGRNLDNQIEFEVHEIDRYAIHSFYDPVSFSNDIAVLGLRTNSSRTPADISESDVDYSADSLAVVAGWGTTSEEGDQSQVNLRKVAIPLLSFQQCVAYFGQGRSGVLPGMLCALHPGGGKDACLGDSGGPLASNSNGKLIGLVSWGVGCARPEWPGVYTNLALYKCWLENLGVPTVKSIYGKCNARILPVLLAKRTPLNPVRNSAQETPLNLTQGPSLPSPGADAGPSLNPDDEMPSATPSSAFRNVSEVNFQKPVLLSDQEKACFPADARLQLQSGEHIFMHQLTTGDRVRVSKNVFSPVFFFGHQDPTKLFNFYRISLESNSTIVLSANHYLLSGGGGKVGPVLVAAKDVVVGETYLRLATGEHSLVSAVVTEQRRGLFNPHTLLGSILVDDIVASCYTTAVAPQLAHILLGPQRLGFRFGLDIYGAMLASSIPLVLQPFASLFSKLTR